MSREKFANESTMPRENSRVSLRYKNQFTEDVDGAVIMKLSLSTEDVDGAVIMKPSLSPPHTENLFCVS